MNNQRTFVRRWLPALALVLCSSSDAAADSGFVVLVNADNPQQVMTVQEFKWAITGGTKQWQHGPAVQLGLTPSEVPETKFLAGLVRLEPRELLRRIQVAVFNGEMRRPQVLRSAADCVAMAASVSGGVCVAPAGSRAAPGTHVLTVQ